MKNKPKKKKKITIMAELSIRTQIEYVSQRFWPDASTIKSVVSIITHHVQERTEQLVHM